LREPVTILYHVMPQEVAEAGVSHFIESRRVFVIGTRETPIPFALQKAVFPSKAEADEFARIAQASIAKARSAHVI
jgi:hypothetical protein